MIWTKMQIIELVSFGSNDDGFEEEDGFESNTSQSYHNFNEETDF